MTEWTLKEVFYALFHQRIDLEGMVLKPNMIRSGRQMREPGKRGRNRSRKQSSALKACVPAAVPGIAFLSGGQSDEAATVNLNAMNAGPALPWPLTFSYGRALQAAPQQAWRGQAENVPAAQHAFAHRARMNGLAALGKWSPELEKQAA